MMDKKVAWAKIHYTFGLLYGQLFLLDKSTKKANKQFSEFEKLIKKYKKN